MNGWFILISADSRTVQAKKHRGPRVADRQNRDWTAEFVFNNGSKLNSKYLPSVLESNRADPYKHLRLSNQRKNCQNKTNLLK